MEPALTSRLCLALLLVIVSLACVSRQEISRITSPSGTLDVVLIEANGGATTSYVHEAYLVKKGQAPSRGVRIASWYGAPGVDMEWRDSNTLAIEHTPSKEETLERSSVLIEGELVRVSLVPEVGGRSSPAGGITRRW